MSSSSEYNGPGREESSADVRNFGNLSPSIKCDIPEDLSLLSFYKTTGCNSGTRIYINYQLDAQIIIHSYNITFLYIELFH